MATDENRCKIFIKSNLLVLLTFLGVVIGFVVGIGVREAQPSRDAMMWIGLLGELYLNVIKMLIVPLIASSIISGTASLDPKSNGKISLVSLAFIVLTNFAGTLIGTALCVLINPGGESTQADKGSVKKIHIQTQDVFADLFRNILPENLVSATFQADLKKLHSTFCSDDPSDRPIKMQPLDSGNIVLMIKPEDSVEVIRTESRMGFLQILHATMTKYDLGERFVNVTINGTSSQQLETFIKGKTLGKSSSVNMLGLLVISSIFGMGTAAVGKVGRPFYKFFHAATEIVLLIFEKILWFTPIGVASLIMREICAVSDLKEEFSRLGLFIGTFMLGLALVLFILHPLIYFVIVRKNPLKFLASLSEPMLIVFATTLTTVAMPESLRKLESPSNNIDRRVTRFAVPLSAAIGRTGSCTFLSASCVFISQLENKDQNAGNIVLIILLVLLMSFAVPSIPSGSLVTIIILLSAIGIPPEAASLLFAFDWFSDRMRSVVNIYFQCLTSAVTYKICQSSLTTEEADPNADTEIIIPMIEQNNVIDDNNSKLASV